jgi:hypothetical protein
MMMGNNVEKREGREHMKRYVRSVAVTGLLLGLGVLGRLSPAYAVPQLILSDGVHTATATGSGGVVTFSGSVGVFTVNVTTGISPNSANMDLNSIDFSTGPGQLTIQLTDTGFTSLGAARMAIGGTSTGSVTYKAYFDTGNTPFATTSLIGTITGAGVPFAGSAQGQGPGTGPYSLTEEVIITHRGDGGLTSFDADVRVPEPSSSLLLGMSVMSLFGYGYWSRRRKP